MDKGEEKRTPGGLPAEAPLSPEGMKRVLDDPEARRKARFRLTISGGMPSEVQPFSLDLDGRGQIAVTRFEAAGAAREDTGRVDETVVLRLLRDLGAAAIATATPPRVRIPPDSLIGRLEISLGGDAQQIVFMADEEQARTAGFHLSPPVGRLIEDLYRIGGEVAGTASLKP